ncbi:hypothetical protein LINPERPRIM_LOCUS12219 [Linum perenne]
MIIKNCVVEVLVMMMMIMLLFLMLGAPPATATRTLSAPAIPSGVKLDGESRNDAPHGGNHGGRSVGRGSL